MATIKEIEEQIEALGVGTPAYHEAMAMYLLQMARAQWRLADQARYRATRAGRRAEALADFAEREKIR